VGDVIGQVAGAPRDGTDRVLWIELTAPEAARIDSWLLIRESSGREHLRRVVELRRNGLGLLARADRPHGVPSWAPPPPGSPAFVAPAAIIRGALDVDVAAGPPSVPVGVIAGAGGAGDLGALRLSLPHVTGPESAHVNVSGVSGLAAKSSFVCWMLGAILQTARDGLAPGIVILNGKFADLLALDEPAAAGPIAEDAALFRVAGVAPMPFPACRYLLPRGRSGAPSSAYVPPRHAVYGFDLDDGLGNLDVLLAGLDDRRRTIAALAADLTDAHRLRDEEMAAVSQWLDLCHELPLAHRGFPLPWRHHRRETTQRFVRELSRALKSGTGVLVGADDEHASLPAELATLRGGEPLVIDIAPLTPEEQSLVVASVVRELCSLRLDPTRPEFPRRVLVFVDELAKFAPRDGVPSPLCTHLIDLAERGRSVGLSLIGAEQLVGAVHPRIIQNAATRVFGRTPAAALGDRAFRSLEPRLRAVLPHLRPGELVIEHAPLPAPLRIRFPRPVHRIPS